MLLQLDDNFRVVVDSSLQNLILEKLEDVKNKQTKEVVRKEWIVQGYHGLSMKSVLLQYRNESVVTDGNLKTLHDILDKLNEIENTIIKVVKSANIKLIPKAKDND